MANYRIYTGGKRGESLGDSLPMMQNSTESDLTFEVFYEDGTAYTFAAGASIAGNFLDLGDEASDPPDVYVISGTLTPTIGSNTFTWARVAADVGQVGRYNLSFELVAADAGVDWTFPIRYDIEEVPNGTLVPAVGLVGVTPEERAWLTAMLAANPTAWEFIPGTYDTATDTYQLKTTTDGQTLNLGREVFLLMRNDNGIAATQLDPKVFVSLGTIAGDEQFKSAIPALGSDIDNTSIWGINTTQADEGGKFKATSYGQVNAVNTSAWELNDDLYVSVDVRGDMTNVKPTINAHAVARVDKVGATDGILSVNTIANTRADTVTGALVSTSYWMTAQTITPVATTFYEELLADQGSVASASEAVLVADNDKQPLAQDHLLEAAIANTALVAGEYSATLEMTLSVAASNQKVYIERYLTDGNGVVIDSGILTEPVGDLGVRPIFVFTSPLLAMETATVTYVTLTGGLADNFAISTGQRLRDHILCEKVGVLGPSVTFTVFFGSDHLSRTFGLAAVTTDNVVNASTVTGASATDAFDTLETDKLPKDALILSKSATYELAAGDEGKTIHATGTWSLNAPDGLDTGFQVAINYIGTGTLTITATTTLNSKGGAVTMANQYGMATLYHGGSNVWYLAGDIE